MADTGLTGHWKGMLVLSRLHSEVHLYFDQKGTVVTGTFEAQGVSSGDSKGEVNGTIDASNNVSLAVVASDTLQFNGQLTGQHTAGEMLFGTTTHLGLTVGTLTLFPRAVPGDIAERY